MPDIGVPELLILLLFALPTIWGLIRAFGDGNPGWGIAIIVSWLVALGWLVGIIYLGTHRRRKVTV